MTETAKTRMTRQRRVILEELRKSTSHPTADELYRMVRERLPRISLGTVYRNLNLLVETGLVQRLQPGGGQWRFDANLERHYHIRCVRCGRVDDLGDLPDVEIKHETSAMKNYRVLSHRLEFSGVCPDCQRSEAEERTEDDPAGECP